MIPFTTVLVQTNHNNHSICLEKAKERKHTSLRTYLFYLSAGEQQAVSVSVWSRFFQLDPLG